MDCIPKYANGNLLNATLTYFLHPMYMKAKLIFLGFLLIFLVQCDNSRVECANVSCLAQSFAIELLDGNGTNLTTNGTYSLEEIKVFKGENQVNENSSNSDNVIFIFISGMEGENTYQISLNNSETDTLILSLITNSRGGDCCGPYFTIETATYNGNVVDIISAESGIDKITVVK